jgi:hypothetical protein
MKNVSPEGPSNHLQFDNNDEVTTWIKAGFAKYSIILFLLSISLVLLLNAFQRSQRKQLFCEVIKPGMSLTEVLGTIEKFGEFGTSQFQQNEKTIILYVLPLNNFGTAMHYGKRGLELGFRDGILDGVVETYRLEDDIRILCE